jgi:hypothetical protein
MEIDKFGANDICIKVYDPSKQELIAVYDNYTQAAKKLGLTYKVVFNATMTKKRRYSPFLDKEVAIRVAGKK